MQKKATRISVLALTLLATACTASYKVVQTDGHTGQQPLDGAASVYVALPKDGSYGSKNYGGSGRIVAGTIARELSSKAAGVEVGEEAEGRDGALSSARKVGARYAVIPVITHWEHRATEWSGRPSRMSIDVSVYDAASEKRLNSRSLTARSRIVSFTPTSLESLLTKPIRDYVNALYGRTAPAED